MKRKEDTKLKWYKKIGKSPDCPHYINSSPKYNPDGWKFCTQCLKVNNK